MQAARDSAHQPPGPTAQDDLAIAEFQRDFQAAREAVSRVVFGHEAAIEHLLAAVVADGHVLLTGVPGLGRTLLARSLAAVLGLSFRRIQFTPDLLPTDVTGTEVLEEGPGGRDGASASSRARSSRASSWRTRSTGARRGPRPRSWRRCRSAR